MTVLDCRARMLGDQVEYGTVSLLLVGSRVYFSHRSHAAKVVAVYKDG